jgi:hypothetical protein
MFRAMFFACGVFTALCGGLLLFVDRVELTDYGAQRLQKLTGQEIAVANAAPTSDGLRVLYAVRRTETPSDESTPPERQIVDPPDWSAFCLLSIGTVTVLYALAIPGRKEEEEDGD